MAQDDAAALFPASFFASAEECAVEAWLAFLGHRWNALILYHLSQGDLRFGELRERLPAVTAKVLTERLGELLRVDLIERGPDGATYAMTDLASRLMPILHSLEVWSRGLPDPRDRYSRRN